MSKKYINPSPPFDFTPKIYVHVFMIYYKHVHCICFIISGICRRFEQQIDSDTDDKEHTQEIRMFYECFSSECVCLPVLPPTGLTTKHVLFKYFVICSHAIY